VLVALAVVRMADGVFVMIFRAQGGIFVANTGCLSVFFIRAEYTECGDVQLVGYGDVVVAFVFSFGRGFKSRVRELKSLGFLK